MKGQYLPLKEIEGKNMYEVLSGTYDEFNGKLEVSVKYAAELYDFGTTVTQVIVVF